MEPVLLCSNCEETAVYCVSDPGANPVEYCAPHMPAHLRDRAANGEFVIPLEPAETP